MIHDCAICESLNLESIWDLPQLPLTEKYGTFNPPQCPPIDQTLLMCCNCGHVQLGIQADPHLLYAPSEYSFRTSQSQSARIGTEKFLSFFYRVTKGRNFLSLLDLGGNDLYLARLSQKFTERQYVIDPVLSHLDGQTINGIHVIGKMIEDVRFVEHPDLIFCRHVLEHIAQPKQVIEKLLQQSSSDALYFFEIPCFENLLEANRFDAIFHQHYHYYDLLVFKRLLYEVGAEYIAHTYHRQGSCGGALLIAFQKAKTSIRKELVNIDQRLHYIKDAIAKYQLQMSLFRQNLQRFSGNIYGYGASLMLATLAYHLKSDLSELICILDDDPKKHETGYQNLPVKILCPSLLKIDPDNHFLITSLENVRVLFNKIASLSPRRILIPMIN